jgi:hypothetical protein
MTTDAETTYLAIKGLVSGLSEKERADVHSALVAIGELKERFGERAVQLAVVLIGAAMQADMETQGIEG